MDLALNNEQKLMIDTVRRFIKEELRPLEEEVERNDGIAPEVARAIYARSKALGLYALNMPSEFGGGGLSAVDTMLDAREWISMVKVHAAEALARVVDRGVQVFGGMGFCKELPIERYYRDARVFRIFDGTSEIHRVVIARSVLKRGPALFDMHR